MNRFHTLATVTAANIESIERPHQSETLTLDSPATEVFTDFLQTTPLMLEQSTPVDEAIELMRRSHVKQKLVIDAGESFRGVITLADLLSVKVARACETTGLQRKDLTVADVMTHRSELHGIDVKALRSTRIGDVLATMESFGDEHVLVIDSTTDSVRGIISSTDIARALHNPVKIASRANSFADICKAVRN